MVKLPFDVLLVIFSFSNKPTLAVLGRVSLEFLEATLPMLYREVSLKTIEELEGLFCERKRKNDANSSLSRINHHLNLSQIQTLSLDFTNLPSVPDSLAISLSRFPNSGPLPVDTLRISFKHGHVFLLPTLYSSLLSLLDPIRLRFDGSTNSRSSTRHFDFPKAPLLSRFARLQEVELEGAVFSKVVSDTGLPYLAFLPPPSPNVRRVVRLHLSSLFNVLNPDAASYVGWMTSAASSLFALDLMEQRSIVLVVRSEEERKETERAVLKVEEKRRSLFVVELS